MVWDDPGLQKSMQIKKKTCEHRLRKRYVELNENSTEIEPNYEPEIVNISKNTQKMHFENDTNERCRKEPQKNRFWLARGMPSRMFRAGGG